MSIEPQKRFDWINGFITAALNSALVNANVHLTRSSSFDAVNSAYVMNVANEISGLSSFPQLYLASEQLHYLFHLESELWGSDYRCYVTFFKPPTQRSRLVLQTFLLTHSFILVERWFQAFLPPSAMSTRGRPSKRRTLFGHANGLFTVQFKDCLASLGAPYNLFGSTTNVEDMSRNNRWQTLQTIVVPATLRMFYQNVCAYSHPVPIIESSLKSCRRKLPDHIFPNEKHHKRNKTRGLKSTWYDALWVYSESIRYHPIAISQVSLNTPFHWNRSVRWCTSLLISGLLCIAAKKDSNHQLQAAWNSAQNRNRILRGVFGTSRDTVF
jgi:hypothetical protein